MKRQAIALSLILVLIFSATEIGWREVSSASSPVWVEVDRLAVEGLLVLGTRPFNVSHSEWRIRWSINPDEVPLGWANGSSFSFRVLYGRYESVGKVSGKLFSEIENGTLIIQNIEKRFFYIELDSPPLAKWEFIIEDNIDSPLLDIVPPVISILSPENKTYDTENVTFIFTVNEPTEYINCFLDDSLIAANQTLSGLSEGTHSVRVHAVDKAENKKDEIVIFSIDVPEPSPPIPTAWIVVAVVLIVAGLGLGLLSYLIKRK